jgi:hypothetical protein
MAHDVFLSYSYQDKAAADAVCHSLESKGLRCWIAPRDVVPGADWQQSILDGIADSKAVILLFTGHTNQSENVKKEISAAFDSNSMVIPFRIEDVMPQGSLKFHLIGVHWLDAFAPPLEEHITHLAKIIHNLPGKNGETPPPGPIPTPIPMPPPLPVPPPHPGPSPKPDPAMPTDWDAVSLDQREGFAFLASIIPFAPGLYMLWRTTYRNDGGKVAPVSRERKIIATFLALLVIALVLWLGARIVAGGHGGSSDLSSDSSSASSAASSAAVEVNSASSAAPDSSASAAAAWTSTTSDTKDRRVKFVNQTTHTIYHIYAWSTDLTDSAAHDMMPAAADLIEPNASQTYAIDDGAGHCTYNFKITRADNASTLYVNNFDVCANDHYNITE